MCRKLQDIRRLCRIIGAEVSELLLTFAIILLVLSIVLTVRNSKKKKTEELHLIAEEQAATLEEKSPPKPTHERFEFKVVGVTKKNEDGKEIQAILKKIASSYKKSGELESYDGMTNKEIAEWGSSIGEFEGQYVHHKVELRPEPDNEYDKNAIKVYLKDAEGNDYHVGYVGKDQNLALKNILDNENITGQSAEFIGGKYKHIDYDPIKDKDIVTIGEEVTRGLKVNLSYRI